MKNQTNQTIAAILTPLGHGGIGVVGVFGPSAGEIVERIFRPRRPIDPAACAVNKLLYGKVVDGEEIIDEAILRRGEDESGASFFEINCHGGIAAVRETLRLVGEAGAGIVDAETFVERLTRERGLDAVQAEAARLLPRALTFEGVCVLNRQRDGALSKAVRELASEMDKGADASDEARSRWIERLERLLATARYGAAMTRPPRVVFLGPPNAGKSTLLNALVGEDRAIVHHEPGTTRDYLAEIIADRGVPIEIVDAAGVRRAEFEPERAGVEFSLQQARKADVTVLLLDGTRFGDPALDELAGQAPMGRTVVAVNKSDLPNCGGLDDLPASLRSFPCVRISALQQEGLGELLELVRKAAGVEEPEGEAVVFTKRQEQKLRAALEALKGRGRDARKARRLLMELLEG